MSRKTASLAKTAISLHFLIDGIGFGIWAALIPTLKQRLELSDIQLSGILLGMVVGAMLSMPLIGGVIAQKGSQRVLTVVAPIYGLALLFPMLAPSHASAIIAATAFGALKGALDVSINTQAFNLEECVRRPINAFCQALWSAGGLLAAFLTSLVLRLGLPPILFVTGSSIALIVTVIFSSRYLLPESGKHNSEKKAGLFESASWPLLQIGLLTFAALFCEGVMMDWGAVYAGRVGLAPEWLAPAAYGVFCGTMMIGRFSGDWFLLRFGETVILKISGFAMLCGLMIIILIHHWVATFIGLGIIGFGASNLVPVFLRAGGAANPGNMGRGVALVSTIGYIGFLAGPPVIGGVSEWFSLPAAFGIVAIFAAVIALLGPIILSRQKTGVAALFDKTNAKKSSSAFCADQLEQERK